MKHRIIAVLLRIYPAVWRKEYGAELRYILEARDLQSRTVVNVVWGGVRQRLRATEPWVLLGLPLMLLMTLLITLSIVAPPPYSPAQDFAHIPASVQFRIALVWASLTMGCGLWTVVRSGGTLPHAGLQTMKMGILRGIPVIFLATLMATGALGVIVIGPGDAPTTFADHGFAITFPSAEGIAPDPVVFFLTPIVGLIDCWIFGAIGGIFGRLIRTKLQPAGG